MDTSKSFDAYEVIGVFGVLIITRVYSIRYRR
jgi:hypothetical protein